MHSMYEHFKEGGWGMWPIVLWLVFVVAITVERSMYLFKASINKDAFLANIQKCIYAGDVGLPNDLWAGDPNVNPYAGAKELRRRIDSYLERGVYVAPGKPRTHASIPDSV